MAKRREEVTRFCRIYQFRRIRPGERRAAAALQLFRQRGAPAIAAVRRGVPPRGDARLASVGRGTVEQRLSDQRRGWM